MADKEESAAPAKRGRKSGANSKIEDPKLISKSYKEGSFSADVSVITTPFAKNKYAHTSFEFDFSKNSEKEKVALDAYIDYIKRDGKYKSYMNNALGGTHNILVETMKILDIQIKCSYDSNNNLLSKVNIIFTSEAGSAHRTYELLYSILFPSIIAAYTQSNSSVKALDKIIKSASDDEKTILEIAKNEAGIPSVSNGELGYAKNLFMKYKKISVVHIFKKEKDFKEDYIERGFQKYATKVGGIKEANASTPETGNMSVSALKSDKPVSNVAALCYLSCVSPYCGISDGRNVLTFGLNSAESKIIVEKLKGVNVIMFVKKLKSMLTKNYKQNDDAIIFNAMKFGILNGLSHDNVDCLKNVTKCKGDFGETAISKAVESIV